MRIRQCRPANASVHIRAALRRPLFAVDIRTYTENIVTASHVVYRHLSVAGSIATDTVGTEAIVIVGVEINGLAWLAFHKIAGTTFES